MVEAVFSLQGRLQRLPYFGGSVALTLVFFAGIAAIVMGGAGAAQSHNWGALAGVVACLLPLVAALLWCSLSLHVRRIRDIGWDPTLVIAGWLVFKLADALILAHLLPNLAAHDHANGTYIGVAVQVALSLTLLLWPSHGGPGAAPDEDRYLRPGPPRWPEPARPARIPRLPRRVGAGGRVVFGRR